MLLSQITIVLCHPEESRNIGSVCRAMQTMDITHLRIVGTKQEYDENNVNTLALHAKGLWEMAEFYNTLEDATKDCAIIAGTTRRRGKKRKSALLLPEEFVAHIGKMPNNENQSRIALVFGNERTGLTDMELDVCTMGVTIPTSELFGSLNLSHAVQIFTYELFRAYNNQKSSTKTISPGYIPISVQKLHESIQIIMESLQKIGFFTQAGKKEMELFWKSILTRALLSKGEATYLEKIFKKAAGLASRNKSDISS